MSIDEIVRNIKVLKKEIMLTLGDSTTSCTETSKFINGSEKSDKDSELIQLVHKQEEIIDLVYSEYLRLQNQLTKTKEKLDENNHLLSNLLISSYKNEGIKSSEEHISKKDFDILAEKITSNILKEISPSISKACHLSHNTFSKEFSVCSDLKSRLTPTSTRNMSRDLSFSKIINKESRSHLSFVDQIENVDKRLETIKDLYDTELEKEQLSPIIKNSQGQEEKSLIEDVIQNSCNSKSIDVTFGNDHLEKTSYSKRLHSQEFKSIFTSKRRDMQITKLNKGKSANLNIFLTKASSLNTSTGSPFGTLANTSGAYLKKMVFK